MQTSSSAIARYIFFILWLSFAIYASDTYLELHSESAILIDAQSGRVLYEHNADKQHVPASLTKIPSLLLTYQAIESGQLSYESPVQISERAAVYNQPARSSRMGLEPGQRLVLRDLMLGMALASGNDSAVAIAELVGGSVENFVDQMNAFTQSLGAKETYFADPAGIMEGSLTTARDYASLVRYYLGHYPQALSELHSVPSFSYPSLQQMNHQGTIRYTIQHNNPIKMIGSYPGADGLKTGYLSEAGYNLVATARQHCMRVIAVVLGVRAPGVQSGSRMREADAAALFDYAFANYAYHLVSTHRHYDALTKQAVVGGYQGRISVAPMPTNALIPYPLTQEEWQNSSINFYMEKNQAPIAKGDVVGRLEVVAADFSYELPIIAQEPVDRLPFWLALNDRFDRFFAKFLPKK